MKDIGNFPLFWKKYKAFALAWSDSRSQHGYLELRSTQPGKNPQISAALQ